MSRIPISTKVLWQALSAAALVILQALGGDTEWVKDLPDYIAPILLVVIPAAIAWIKKESNPAGSALDVAAAQLKKDGWTPPPAA